MGHCGKDRNKMHRLELFFLKHGFTRLIYSIKILKYVLHNYNILVLIIDVLCSMDAEIDVREHCTCSLPITTYFCFLH